MLSTILLFDGDLRDFVGRGQNKIWMLNAILTPIRHADDKRLKRHRAEQLAIRAFIAQKLT